jgi:hypothetical protein
MYNEYDLRVKMPMSDLVTIDEAHCLKTGWSAIER